MRVYVVCGYSNENNYIVGVYRNKKEAIRRAQEEEDRQTKEGKSTYGYDFESWRVIE